MSIAALIRAMADAGAPLEAIALAVEAVEGKGAEIEARRATDRERKQRQRSRDRGVTVTGPARDGHDDTPAPSSPPDPPNTPTHGNNNTPRARADRFPAPQGVSEEQWRAFRTQRKKPLNERSYDLVCSKLRRLEEDGWPPGDMIDRAIERGWETVFEPKDQDNGQRRPTGSVAGHQPDPFETYRAQVDADLAAEAAGCDPLPAGGHGGSLSAH